MITKICDYKINYGSINIHRDVTNKICNECQHFNSFNGHFTDHLPGIAKNLSFHIWCDNTKFTFDISEAGMLRSEMMPKILLDGIKLLYGFENYYRDVTYVLLNARQGYYSLNDLFGNDAPSGILLHNQEFVTQKVCSKPLSVQANTLRIILLKTSSPKLILEITNNGLIRNITELLKKKK